MEIEKKTFAFKLADKKNKEVQSSGVKWKARDGLSIAGCTQPSGGGEPGDTRETIYIGQLPRPDAGIAC